MGEFSNLGRKIITQGREKTTEKVAYQKRIQWYKDEQSSERFFLVYRKPHPSDYEKGVYDNLKKGVWVGEAYCRVTMKKLTISRNYGGYLDRSIESARILCIESLKKKIEMSAIENSNISVQRGIDEVAKDLKKKTEEKESTKNDDKDKKTSQGW